MAQSAIVVVVEEAEPVVGAHRLRHDPVASLGVPAHVTILYPFRPVVDAEADDVLSAIARAIPPFEVTFARTGRFPEGVLYLSPEPSGDEGALCPGRQRRRDVPGQGGRRLR
jgi:hypothetical protein